VAALLELDVSSGLLVTVSWPPQAARETAMVPARSRDAICFAFFTVVKPPFSIDQTQRYAIIGSCSHAGTKKGMPFLVFAVCRTMFPHRRQMLSIDFPII